MAGHIFAAVSLAVGYRSSDVGLRLSDLPRRRLSPKVRSVKLGGQRFNTCPSTLVQERHDLLLNEVLEEFSFHALR